MSVYYHEKNTELQTILPKWVCLSTDNFSRNFIEIVKGHIMKSLDLDWKKNYFSSVGENTITFFDPDKAQEEHQFIYFQYEKLQGKEYVFLTLRKSSWEWKIISQHEVFSYWCYSNEEKFYYNNFAHSNEKVFWLLSPSTSRGTKVYLWTLWLNEEGKDTSSIQQEVSLVQQKTKHIIEIEFKKDKPHIWYHGNIWIKLLDFYRKLKWAKVEHTDWRFCRIETSEKVNYLIKEDSIYLNWEQTKDPIFFCPYNVCKLVVDGVELIIDEKICKDTQEANNLLQEEKIINKIDYVLPFQLFPLQNGRNLVLKVDKDTGDINIVDKIGKDLTRILWKWKIENAKLEKFLGEISLTQEQEEAIIEILKRNNI